MILKLTNNKNTYSFEVEDLNNGEKLFYHFQIPTANMEDGNYKMVLLDGDEIITEEQVCIGAFNPQAIQYSRGENVYINAPFEANLEEVKEVEITAIETTVLPSEGYDGIKAVEVNAQPIFDEGYNVGNAEGIEVGKAEQKALLEPITITENGTYENENGYSTIEVNVSDTNGSYDEGYTDGYAEGEANGVENAGSIIAETARVLDITENGLYVSRYSEIPTPDVITGVYPDGTVFYNYAELNGKVFNTNITATPTTRLELWYKGDNNLVGDAYNVIIGAGKNDSTGKKYEIRYNMQSNSELKFTVGYSTLDYTWDENVWHHILIAKETEDASFTSLWIDEVKVGNFGNISFNPQSTFYINGIEYDLGGVRRANGCFGMVKIDDTIIIPTADGFLNTNTGELLEVVQGGSYDFTDNMIIPEGNLIKTVSVNVTPKIDIAQAGIKFGYSSFTTLPEWADFSNVTDFSYMFALMNNLTNAPMFNTSIVISIDSMFYGCYNLENVPNYNTENVTNARNLFYSCQNLKNPPTYLNLLKCNNMEQLFYDVRLKDYSFLSNWDINPKANMSSMITTNDYVEYIPAIPNEGNTDYYQSGIIQSWGDFNKLTYFGGYIGRKYNLTSTSVLTKCPNLIYESCISILNNLYDFTGNGEVPESSMGKLTVHPNFLTTVGDEISIGTNKGWIITA